MDKTKKFNMSTESKYTPLQRYKTVLFLPGNIGGFDVRHCPDADSLARFIEMACNSHAELLAALEFVNNIRHLPEAMQMIIDTGITALSPHKKRIEDFIERADNAIKQTHNYEKL